MYVLSASNRRVSVELVGKDKIQKKLGQLEEMKGASLSYGGVSSVGNISGVMPSKILIGLSPIVQYASICLF